jgi:hypothetical protein
VTRTIAWPLVSRNAVVSAGRHEAHVSCPDRSGIASVTVGAAPGAGALEAALAARVRGALALEVAALDVVAPDVVAASGDVVSAVVVDAAAVVLDAPAVEVAEPAVVLDAPAVVVDAPAVVVPEPVGVDVVATALELDAATWLAPEDPVATIANTTAASSAPVRWRRVIAGRSAGQTSARSASPCD